MTIRKDLRMQVDLFAGFMDGFRAWFMIDKIILGIPFQTLRHIVAARQHVIPNEMRAIFHFIIFVNLNSNKQGDASRLNLAAKPTFSYCIC